MKTFQQLMAEAKQTVKEVNPKEANDLLQSKKALAIDVREPEELENGKVPGAYHIPRGLLELQIERALPDRSQEIVVYCAGGVRSVLAAKTLQEMGYANACSMSGGFQGWMRSGLPAE